MTGRICRQRQHCDNLHFPLVLCLNVFISMCISLTTARGRKQEENAFHSCVIGLCICWLCTCLLFPVSMWVYALLYTFSLCVDVAHQGVYHSPNCQMSLVDWTLCLKRTKMYSWVVAQEAQFTACCLSLAKERQIWWIHGTNCWIWWSLLVFGSQTEHCGWGAQAAEFIRKGDFVIEYTGEGM